MKARLGKRSLTRDTVRRHLRDHSVKNLMTAIVQQSRVHIRAMLQEAKEAAKRPEDPAVQVEENLTDSCTLDPDIAKMLEKPSEESSAIVDVDDDVLREYGF